MKHIFKSDNSRFVYLKYNYSYWLKNIEFSNTPKTIIYRYNFKKFTYLFKYKK